MTQEVSGLQLLFLFFKQYKVIIMNHNCSAKSTSGPRYFQGPNVVIPMRTPRIPGLNSLNSTGLHNPGPFLRILRLLLLTPNKVTKSLQRQVDANNVGQTLQHPT